MAPSATDQRTWLGLPSHVIVMLGASTAGYALVLAGVAALQARSEAGLAAARAPAVAGVERLAAGHDLLTTTLDRAQAEYNSTVRAYLAAGGSLDELHAQLGAFAGLVGDIAGVSQNLPTTVKLPVVQRSTSSVKKPSTSGTTGASGG